MPTLDVAAPVQPMGLRPNRDLDIPADPAVVGWWDGSALAGSAIGQTVLAGHVYNRGYGVGALADLGALQQGDPVVVTGEGGAVHQYTVAAVEHYRKASLPLDLVFGQQTGPRLVLITCGDYDKRLDRYLDNIVVFADPA